MVDTKFWQGKSVLLTGHTGFKGSWLALWLTQLGAHVHGYALAPSEPKSLFDEARIEPLINSHIGDIRDALQLKEYISQHKPDVIFHLAAQPIVRESFSNPVLTFDTNVMGTINVLEAARKVESVQAMVIVTSDKCYDNKEWHWGYRETEALGGHDPYSASKACAELAVQSYRLSFMGDKGTDTNHCSIATARAGNVIGGGDWAADRLIPDIIESINTNNNIVLRYPNAIRPWQHVLEPLAGYLMLAEQLTNEGETFAEAWNFGPLDNDARPVSWITEQLTHLFGSSTSWQKDAEAQPHEAQHLKLDCSKARDRLGWSPVWDLSECLAEIVVWHQAHRGKQDMQQVSVDTINRFTAALSTRL